MGGRREKDTRSLPLFTLTLLLLTEPEALSAFWLGRPANHTRIYLLLPSTLRLQAHTRAPTHWAIFPAPLDTFHPMQLNHSTEGEHWIQGTEVKSVLQTWALAESKPLEGRLFSRLINKLNLQPQVTRSGGSSASIPWVLQQYTDQAWRCRPAISALAGVEKGRSEVHGHPWRHSKFRASMGYTKTMTQNQTRQTSKTKQNLILLERLQKMRKTVLPYFI